MIDPGQEQLPSTPFAARSRNPRVHATPGRIRIVHVINSFEYGGAESMLCNLLLHTDRARFEPSVVALIDDLTVAGPIVRAGIPLVTMGMRPGVPDPRGVVRLARHLRRQRPDVVQTWMDHSNLIGGIAARLARPVRPAKVVWGVHHSNHVPGLAKRSTLVTVACCARLSRRLADRIVCCSEHARGLYAQHGFAPERMTVIPNGFDTAHFRPDPDARSAVRREIGVGSDAPIVGLVARYDPCKDHATFLRAVAALRRDRPQVQILMCGVNVDASNAELVSQLNSFGLMQNCHLLGARRDVARVYAALDVLASSSVSEAFPLVLGEAMSCGVPCVATDAGDSALIVGDTGRIVPVGDANALARALGEVLSMSDVERTAISAAARKRVQERFDLTSVTRRYAQLYESVMPESETARASEYEDVVDEPVASLP